MTCSTSTFMRGNRYCICCSRLKLRVATNLCLYSQSTTNHIHPQYIEDTMATSLAVPVAYITILITALAIFSRVYRRRKLGMSPYSIGTDVEYKGSHMLKLLPSREDIIRIMVPLSPTSRPIHLNPLIPIPTGQSRQISSPTPSHRRCETNLEDQG